MLWNSSSGAVGQGLGMKYSIWPTAQLWTSIAGELGSPQATSMHALGLRVDEARLAEQVGAAHAGHPLVGEHERDGAPLGTPGPQIVEGLGRQLLGDHRVVGSVALAQLAAEHVEAGEVVVDGQDDGGVAVAGHEVTVPGPGRRQSVRRRCATRRDRRAGRRVNQCGRRAGRTG